MKEVIIAVTDETKTEVVEKRSVAHLSELGDSVKEAVKDFTVLNGGVVIPPVVIQVHDQDTSDAAEAEAAAAAARKSADGKAARF